MATFTSFDFPEAALTQADDINERGQIVGAYIDANGGTHRFPKSRDSCTSIDFPGAAVTTAWAINDRGQIVGTHRDAVGGSAARLYCTKA